MNYLILISQVLAVFLGLRIYMKLAPKYGIFDIPNDRSSHDNQVIRGAGIVFYLAIVLHQILAQFPNPYFTLGLTILVAVSFLDDIRSVSPWLRSLCQLLAVLILFMELNVLQFGWWIYLPAVLLAASMLNAYNFMDGINGITGIYSLVFLGSLLLLGDIWSGSDRQMMVLLMASLMIFGFYNFRKNAVVFAGDSGSMSLAFLILFLTSKIIIVTGDPTFILLLAVYGIDAGLTILHRLLKGENIFSAHRSHLYQQLSNDLKWPQLRVSMVYGTVQALLNLGIIWNYHQQVFAWKMILPATLIFLCVVYLLFKRSLVFVGSER